MSKVDQLERLMNLVQILLNAKKPLSLVEIVQEVPGYPPGKEAYRGAFERDKRTLREEGIEIDMVEIGGEAQQGYRINPDRYYLPELNLTAAEQRALAIAVAGVADGTGYGAGALYKLGEVREASVPVIAQLEPPDGVAELYDAVRAKALVTFTYSGEERTVRPASVFTSKGRWYLAGYADARADVRVYRIDRIVGEVAIGAPMSGTWPEGVERPRGFHNLIVDGADAAADPDVVLALDAVATARVRMELGDAIAVTSRDDGRFEVALSCTNAIFARSFTLSMGERAEVLGPPHFRTSIVDWLSAIVAERDGSLEDSDADLGDEVQVHAMEIAAAPSPFTDVDPDVKVTRMTGPQRFRRLLGIMTYLAQVGEARISDLAERFSLTEAQVVKELELAACCGTPPYSPDQLLEILVDDEWVSANLPEEMAKPRRLSRREGFALSASAHLILDPFIFEDSSLASAVAKLDTALGTDAVLGVEVEAAATLAKLRGAVQRERLRITYFVPHRDELTERIINPLSVVLWEGNGYVEAYCEQAGAVRVFRADRIDDVEVLGAQPDGLPAPELKPEDITSFLDDAPVATLRVSGAARWVADSILSMGVTEVAPDLFDVEVRVASERWLAILLIQAGVEATVLKPPTMRRLGADLAAAILENY